MRIKSLVRPMKTLIIAFAMAILSLPSMAVNADTCGSKSAAVKYEVYAVGEYKNWEGVSNVSEFLDGDGNYCFAYNKPKAVIVVRTRDGKVQKDKVSLKKSYPLFGGVACDGEGNYYLVTGRENEAGDEGQDAVFVSKYDQNGQMVATVGDDGSSSLGSWYSDGFYTKIPFDYGNCDLAINGDYLVVHYAREMYNGHQSNSVLAININTMDKVELGNIYSSHSFAQRAIPYGDGFVFASEGDCYNRAFTITTVADLATGSTSESDVFHFWVKAGALDDWNMSAVNNNFAHMGDLAVVDDCHIALVGTSVESLTEAAASEKEQLFVQIFDPTQDLSQASAYVTSGTRSGYSGGNGDEAVTDYGVKWLTNYSGKYSISHPQAVSDGNGNLVILYELYKKGTYKGVYYMVVDQAGEVVTNKTKFSSTAYLNPCESPICSNGTIYWTANKYKNSKNTMYLYSLKLGD